MAHEDCSALSASIDMNNDGKISEEEWMNPDLAPGSTFYGAFL